MNKKIIFIVSSLNYGGAERFIAYLTNYLSNNGFEIILALLRREGEFLKELNPKIKIYDLKCKRARCAYFKISTLLYKEKPQIVYGVGTHVNILISFIVCFYPKIKFIGRETSIISERLTYGIKSRIIKMLYSRLNKLYCIIAISHGMKEDLIEKMGIKKEKIKIFPNVIDLVKVNEKAEEEVILEINKINLVTVARLEPVKGIGRVLEIMEALIKKNPNYFLNIVGDGSEKIKLEKEVLRRGIENHIKFWGKTENPYKIVKKANLFILTSFSESFGNVILEANALGKYVLAYECPGGIKELIENGVNGYIVKKDDVKEFVDKIIELEDKKIEIEKIKDKSQFYSIENQLKIYKNYFKILLRG